MALESTNIPDFIGAAVYMLHDGNTITEGNLLRLEQEIVQRTQNTVQIVRADVRMGDGLRIKEFYGITTLPAVMIIMDDDTVPQQWGPELPRAEDVSYAVSQINGSMRSS